MKTGLEIFQSFRENHAAHFHADDWTVVEYAPDLESAIPMFEWLQENQICYILLAQKDKRLPGFAFWNTEDAVAFKLRWLQ